MKVGRFTITNLTESDKSDVSEDAKTFRSPEDSAEIKIKVEKESLDFQSKSVNKTECFRNFQKKSSIQDTLSSNVRSM